MILISSLSEFRAEVNKLCSNEYMKDIYKAYVRANGTLSYKIWMEFLVLNSPFYECKFD